MRSPVLFVAALGVLSSVILAQPSPEELAPVYAELWAGPPSQDTKLEPRVPLSTNDKTSAPLVDLQVFAPPVVPSGGSKCVVELLKHDFGDGSYDSPAIAAYTPPGAAACGKVGQWAAISLNLSVYS
jgi:hypothetical protein